MGGPTRIAAVMHHGRGGKIPVGNGLNSVDVGQRKPIANARRQRREHRRDSFLFQNSAPGWLAVRTPGGRGDESRKVGHAAKLAADGLTTKLPVTDLFL